MAKKFGFQKSSNQYTDSNPYDHGRFDPVVEMLFHYLGNQELWGNDCYPWHYEDRITYEKDGARRFKRVKSEAYLSLHPKTDLRGKIITETCKNPKCINPNHLIANTRGIKKPILTDDQKRRVCKLYQSGTSSDELAKLFGCKLTYIKKVISDEIKV